MDPSDFVLIMNNIVFLTSLFEHAMTNVVFCKFAETFK